MTEQLKKQYPNLKAVAAGKYSNQTLAAKNIRIELKANFPGVKFSVTSKSYSMGDSVDVSWTDGPTDKEVKAIVDKYQYGWFDGMTDCYNSNNNPFNDVFGGTKHLFTKRNYSDAVTQLAINAIWDRFGIEKPVMTTEDFNQGNTWYVKIGQLTAQSMIHRELQQVGAIA